MLSACLGLLFAIGVFDQRLSHSTAHIGNRAYNVLVARTAETQQQGLGGRSSIPADGGMLFWFARSEQQCFWMKDMRFSLDIIWLGDDKKVTHIEQNVSPASYPHQYCPAQPARYVIELNAGQVAANGVRPGQSVSF